MRDFFILRDIRLDFDDEEQEDLSIMFPSQIWHLRWFASLVVSEKVIRSWQRVRPLDGAPNIVGELIYNVVENGRVLNPLEGTAYPVQGEELLLGGVVAESKKVFCYQSECDWVWVYNPDNYVVILARFIRSESIE